MSESDRIRLQHMLDAALVHACFDIDFGILWATVVSALPPLAREIERLLAAER